MPACRHTIRLQHCDYTQAGAYFVTLCTRRRAHHLGEVTHGRVNLTCRGEVVQEEWLRSPRIRPTVQLDSFVIMPNHLHGIVFLEGQTALGSGRGTRSKCLYRACGSLGSLIAGFKQAVTLRIAKMEGSHRPRLWQRNYYEHVIRTKAELAAVRRYIEENPLRWTGS